MAISFEQVGVFKGAVGGPNVLQNPTSLQFGPDGRLYVSEQNGSINAFTVELQGNTWVATEHELMVDGNGDEIVKNIQNHNDDGSEKQGGNDNNRQVTGIVVAGTADEPILYVSSSDPDIASNGEKFLDTNSGVVTRASWNSTSETWEVVDLVRGLPRSEENHAVNGMVISPDGSKLFLNVGGNTNNGAPSGFFSYTGEYVLSGSVLEIDLDGLDLLPTATDPQGGQQNTPRDYKYDLPTLDDPNVPNVTDGVGEDANGMDEDGPWGGNDGLNMAILPADAPLRLYADGFRNHYDLAQTASGDLYTVDNGSNGGLGSVPNTEAGDADGDGVAGEAVSTPNDGGSGDPEPLFKIEEGGYYGHPNPIRANQNQAWTVYDDDGNPDTSLTVNSVPDLSALVPDGVQIEEGFLIDPSKFAVGTGQTLADLSPTDQIDRLLESGVRVKRDGNDSNAIVTVGSSTNGIVVYDSGGQAFDGVLDGKLFVTQFNDNVTLLNINAAGDALEPVLEAGPDGEFGTADDVVQAGGADGILEIANNSLGIGLINPLDVINGPNGTLWVAEIGGNEVTVLAPSDFVAGPDLDGDNDGIDNAVDPFLRDATNGASAVVTPGETLLWDFDPNQDGNLPGPQGFGGGLTGVMIDGTTDFEQFFQAPSDLPGQIINLDNVKFITAAAGGTTVIEEVSNGDPFGTSNNGEFLFHTGVSLAPTVGTMSIKWIVANPVEQITGNFQQIGGYIGTGDQANYLKVVAIRQGGSNAGIQLALENNDDVADGNSYTLPASDIFDASEIPVNGEIVFELVVDLVAETATPTVTYDTNSGPAVVTGDPLSLAGSNVLTALNGEWQVQGQDSGLAVGLFSTNFGEPDTAEGRFQAVFKDIEITATEAALPPDAVDDVFFTGVDTPITISVAELLANDSDLNPSDLISFTGVSNVQNGVVAIDDNQTPGDTSDDVITFTPDAAFSGTAGFDYSITDGSLTDTASVEVSVSDRQVLYRVNAGGGEIAAQDDGPDWSADIATNNSPFLSNPGSNSTAGFAAVDPGPTVPASVPGAIFDTERWDQPSAPEMAWEFPVAGAGLYEINLYLGNGFGDTSTPGTRVFDVSVEGSVPVAFDDIDLSATFGHQVGGLLSTTALITDGGISLEFLHGTENPLINGIEIVQVGSVSPPLPIVSILNAEQTVNEGVAGGQVQISIATNQTVPADETVDITFQIEPLGATPGAGGDYQYTSPSATFGGGTYTDTVSIAGSSSDVTIPIAILEDLDIETGEAFSVTITSVSGNAQIGAANVATVTIEDNDGSTGDVLFRINAGGEEVAANDGGMAWSADLGAVAAGSAIVGPSSPFLVDRGIDGDTGPTSDNVTFGAGSPAGPGTNGTGAPDALFTTERFSTQPNPDNIGYAFDVENGEYFINLYFDELFFEEAGGRVFSVGIEGTTVLENFDTFATFGNNSGVQSFVTTVADGELNIEFLKTATNNPHIAAIEILTSAPVGPKDTIDGVPVQGNDFSTDAAAPTTVVLPADGSVTVVSNLEGGHNDRDFITVSVPDGFRLADIILDDYSADPGNSGFIGLKLGSDFVIDPAIPGPGITPDGVVDPGDLNGGYVFNEGDEGTDLLPSLNGSFFGGFDEAALTGDITVWLNQGGDASQATLTFVTEALPEQGPIVAAINAGGPALTQGGIDFAADAFFLGGGTFTDGSNFDNNNGNGTQSGFDGTVYKTERFAGVLNYEIPVAAGEYSVELYFSEIFLSAPGGRVFDVFVEDVLVLDDFDVLAATNGDFNQPVVITVPDSFTPETAGAPEALDIDLVASVDNAKISGIVVRAVVPEPEPTGGAATLTINDSADGIETSNFGNGSFSISNVGTKDIAFIEIDVTDALLPDAVFDPFGVAGDSTAKALTLQGNSDGGTGLVVPTGGFDEDAIGITYIGTGGVAGYEKLRLDFTDFNPGETISFGVDMDPNSIAGSTKATLDSGAPLAGAGSDNIWDVGGIGGAELSGSLFTVGYDDETSSVGQLIGQGTGQQMGAEALSSQDSPDLAVSLTVNGLGEGAEGTYSDGGPQILVQGPAGETARILVTKGFIVPFTNEFADTNGAAFDPVNVYHDQLDAQIAALEASGFPANNAVEMQYVDIALDGTVQDISSLFDFTQVAAFDLSVPDADNEFGVLDEAQLPLGIVAGIVDPSNDQPKGPVTSPIHLTFAENAPPVIGAIADVTIDEGAEASFAVTATDADEDPITLSVVLTRDIDDSVVDPSEYSFTDNGDGTATFSWLTDEPDDGAYTAAVSADDGVNATVLPVAIIVNEIAETTQTVLYRVNAGGAEAAASDSGPAWSADTLAQNSPFLVNAGSNNVFPSSGNANLNVDLSMLAGTGVTAEVIGIERWDNNNGNNGEMLWAFPVDVGTEVIVNLYVAELFQSIPDIDESGDPTGDRIFDVTVDGVVPPAFDDIDPYALAGNAFLKGAVVSHQFVSDGSVDLEFIHVVENPAIKAIEIIAIESAGNADGQLPTASLNATPVEGGTSSYQFSVTYTDNFAIDVSSLDGGDITVENSAIGFSTAATLISVDVPADGTPRTATYAFDAPGGVFDAADNGDYTISLNATEVLDINGLPAAATQLGTIAVDIPVANASALIEVTPDSALTASTFTASSFQITNTSEPGVEILSVSFDLSTGILPDMVFDPTGAGGDATASPLTPNAGAAATGFVVPGDPAADPFSAPRNGGFDVLDLAFTDFQTGEQFLFTTDVDPNSIQGVPGAGAAGAASGYELTGATVTVAFSNGQTLVGSLFEDGSLGGSQVLVEAELPSAPTIEVLGAGPDEAGLPGTQVTVSGDPTIRVTGTEGDYVALLQMDSRLFIASGEPPFDVAGDELPFYANEAMAGKTVYTGQIGSGGILDIPVTLLETEGGATPDGGLNQFIAVTSATPYAVDQATSQTSNLLTVKPGTPLAFDDPGVMTFDGTNGTVIELPHSPDFEIAEGTIAFSFIAADTNGDQGLFAKDAAFFGNGGHTTIYLQGTTLVARLQDLSTSAELEFAGITAGQEYEVAVTFGAGGVELWVDGNLVANAPLTISWEGNQEFVQWGGRGWASDLLQSGFDAPFEGVIADKQIYASVLNASQIAALAASSAASNNPPNAVADLVETDEDAAVTFDPLLNDSDDEEDTLQVVGIASDPTSGTAGLNPDGTVTYVPNADFAGSDSFQVSVSDGFTTVTSDVSVTVNPVNDDPIAVADADVTVLGSPVVIAVLDNDIDVDQDDLIVTGVSNVVNGTADINQDGTVTFTPTAAFTGSAGFDYTISDGNGGQPSTASVSVEVLEAPNTPPTAVADTVSVDEDGDVTFQPGDNDIDPDADTSVIASGIALQPTNGIAQVNLDGTVTYTPNADYNGGDSFDVTVTDGDGGFDTATVSVTVNPVDDDPVAANDAATTPQDTPVIVNVVANDDDADGEALTVVAFDDPENGTVVDNQNGTLTYTPDPGFSGVETFDYTVSDGDGPTATATVSVTVTSFPTPIFDQSAPMVLDGSNDAVLELPHSAIYEIPQGTVGLTFTAADTNGTQGLFAKDAAGFVGSGNHFALYLVGSTLFARFQNGDSVSLSVGGILPGVAYDVAATFGPEGSKLYLDGALVAQNPLVMDWSAPNVQFLQWGALGWASATGQPGFVAPFEGTLENKQIYDVALSDDQVVELHADGPPNAPPTLVDDQVTTAEDTPVTFDPTANDLDPDSTTLTVQGTAGDPANASVEINPDGTVTITPDADFFGSDTFDLVITDNDGNFESSTVAFTVTPVEDDPVAGDDTATTEQDIPVTIAVLENDSDGDDDTLTVADITSGPSNGTAEINPDGTVTYTPTSGFLGNDSFVYELSDGDGPTDTATVSVNVTAEPVFPSPVFSQPGLETYSGSAGDVDNYAPTADLNISEGTIAFSFLVDNAGPAQGLVVKDAGGFVGGGNHFASYVQNGQLFARFQDGSDSATAQIGGIQAGQEYEVAAVFSSEGVELYLDGGLVFQETGFVMDWSDNNEWLQVGANGWGSATGAANFTAPLDGQIADVEIYDQVLELSEIQQLADASSFDIA
ncbi:MAG: tandem-95 repeat protein [Pseudomonadota bacterium]